MFAIHSEEKDALTDLEIESVLVDKSGSDDLIRIFASRKPERVEKVFDRVELWPSRKALVEKRLKIKTDF